MRRSDPQQSNELPVGRSALIFLKGFVFEPLDADLDHFRLADKRSRIVPFQCRQGTIIARTDGPNNSTRFGTIKRASAAHSRRWLWDCGHCRRRHRIWNPPHTGISCSSIGKSRTHHCHLVSRRDLCLLLHSLRHRTWDHASARGWMVCVFSPCIRRVRWILGGLH